MCYALDELADVGRADRYRGATFAAKAARTEPRRPSDDLAWGSRVGQFGRAGRGRGSGDSDRLGGLGQLDGELVGEVHDLGEIPEVAYGRVDGLSDTSVDALGADLLGDLHGLARPAPALCSGSRWSRCTVAMPMRFSAYDRWCSASFANRSTALLHQGLGQGGVGGAAAGDIGQVAEGVGVLAVQLGLGEEADPVGVGLVPIVGVGEGVLGHPDGPLALAGLPHVGVGAGLHRIQHGLGARARAVPAAVLREVDQLQGVVGPPEVDHLAAHAGQDVRAQRLVAGLLGRVQGEDEVLLGGGLEPHVVRHPAGEFGQLGGDLEQLAGGGLGLGLLEEVRHLVQLADDRLAAQAAAALGVPLPEHHGGGLQQLQLGLGEPAGAARRRPGLGLLAAGRAGTGHEPALHGLDEGGARGEGQRGPEEAAPRQHQVAARELAEQGHGLRARPGQVDAGRGR